MALGSLELCVYLLVVLEEFQSLLPIPRHKEDPDDLSSMSRASDSLREHG